MIRVLSLGAGVQSTTLALMAAKGEIDPPDCAIFADTGWEPAAVYEHLGRLEALLPFPVHRVSAGNIRDDIFAGRRPSGEFPGVPWFVRNPNGTQGMGHRQCTTHYKLDPIAREMRRMLGYKPRQRIPEGAAEVWLGITTDEAHRMRPAPRPWQTSRWPLIDLRMSRADCRSWLERHKHPQPPKSSCVCCPFRGDAAWADMRDRTPAEFADAVAADRAIRLGGHTCTRRDEQFVHRSFRPLDQADLRPESQGDLFGNECEGMCGV